jgi:hypothetical protein
VEDERKVKGGRWKVVSKEERLRIFHTMQVVAGRTGSFEVTVARAYPDSVTGHAGVAWAWFVDPLESPE